MNWQQLAKPKSKTKFHPQKFLGTLVLTLALGLSLNGPSLASIGREKTYEDKLFEVALAFTLYFEGNLSDHPADKGGRTYKGILQTDRKSVV